MTSNEAAPITKKVNEANKKASPLKVVNPIIRKYTGHRKGRIKKKLKFPRLVHNGQSNKSKQIKPQLKTILPKTNAGDVIILEPELLPCALNLQKRKRRESENDANANNNEQTGENEEKSSENLGQKESAVNTKANKSRLITITKRKMKYYKNIQATLGTIGPEIVATKDKREECFAENYLLRIQQRFKGKDEALYNQFVDLICTFQENGATVIETYKKIKEIFSSHPDLRDEFVAFLTPEQAVECGVFMEHLLLTTMTDFLNMTEIYFSKSPHQLKKIHAVLESLALKQNITTDDVTTAVLPLLKGNSVLTDYFLQLIPDFRPPENFLTDFEEIDCPEVTSDLSDDEEVFETIQIPEVEDPFGGDNCPCDCHDNEDEKFKNRVNHCTPCSTKFINGKIFIQFGKLLRPAKVVFEDHDMAYHRERLIPKLYPKRGNKKNRITVLKETLSPTKSCNLSSDEFKSDIEDDEKARMKLGLCKSPRTSRKKDLLPKNCDKNIPRSIYSEPKVELVDIEDKILTFGSNFENSVKIQQDAIPSMTEVKDLNCHVDNNNFVSLSHCFNEEDRKSSDFPPQKPLDLPELDMDTSEIVPSASNSRPIDVGGEKTQNLGISPSVLITKEGSKSPPVISIPDSATSLFSSAKPILTLLEDLDESELILLESENKSSSSNNNEKSAENSCPNSVPAAERSEIEVKEENDRPWKLEEDRVILQTLQVEESCEETFIKISNKIPDRNVEDVKKRFKMLMNMLYEMKLKQETIEAN